MMPMLATHHATRIDSRSPPTGGTVTRASPPSLTSGYGALMEQEQDLEAANASYLGSVHGRAAVAIEQVLRNHQGRLAANLTLLEQRYQMLPYPARFHVLPDWTEPRDAASAPGAATESLDLLPRLLALHQHLLEQTDLLLVRRSDGQRGEMILAQVARNHAEMAAMLADLLRAGEAAGDPVPIPVIAAAAAGSDEEGWENEGGGPLGTASGAPRAALLER